jgi:hypothetical protein
LRCFAAVPEPPAGFIGALEPAERVVTTGELAGGGHLVLTQLGMWVPEGAEARRVGWHLVSAGSPAGTAWCCRYVLIRELSPARWR